MAHQLEVCTISGTEHSDCCCDPPLIPGFLSGPTGVPHCPAIRINCYLNGTSCVHLPPVPPCTGRGAIQGFGSARSTLYRLWFTHLDLYRLYRHLAPAPAYSSTWHFFAKGITYAWKTWTNTDPRNEIIQFDFSEPKEGVLSHQFLSKLPFQAPKNKKQDDKLKEGLEIKRRAVRNTEGKPFHVQSGLGITGVLQRCIGQNRYQFLRICSPNCDTIKFTLDLVDRNRKQI